MQTMFCFLGRTGAGKDTIVQKLVEQGLCVRVCSYADYPCRPDQKEGREHHFLSKEEFDTLKINEHILAYVEINGHRYCATAELLARDSQEGKPFAYIIDPNGIDFFRQYATVEVNYYVIYIYASENDRRLRTSGTRGDFDFDSRNSDEDSMFTNFELQCNCDLIVDNSKYSLDENVNAITDFIKNPKSCGVTPTEFLHL